MINIQKETFCISVTKDYLTFSSAHFATFGSGEAERLHGHNYQVAFGATGDLDQNGYVANFVPIKKALRRLVDFLDHHLLLPEKSATINVNVDGDEIECLYGGKRYLFPSDDCLILPVENTSVELLAQWILRKFLDELPMICPESKFTTCWLEVEESSGQRARCELLLNQK